MTVITLSSDFNHADYACGLLHGVIWSIAPGAEIVDLTHDLPRHDVLSGALLLYRSLPYFPAGSVHVVVVDPGVGTRRRPLAARLGEQYFIGPDNGLVTLAARRCLQHSEPVQYFHLDRPAFWLEDVSSIFHGRDIFAPAAAHLAAGVRIDDMGSPIEDPVLLEFPLPERTAFGLLGRVVHVDHFGNLSTNIDGAMVRGRHGLEVKVGPATIRGLSLAFGERPAGELVALIDSSGFVTVAVVNGSAESLLGTGVGSTVEIHWSSGN